MTGGITRKPGEENTCRLHTEDFIGMLVIHILGTPAHLVTVPVCQKCIAPETREVARRMVEINAGTINLR